MQIDVIQKKFQDSDIFNDDEKKGLKIKRNKSGTDSVIFARLFLLSYDTFYNNLYQIADKEFIEFLDGFKDRANKLRLLIEDYDRIEVNTYFSEMKVRCNIIRKDMGELMGYFFRIFVDEENLFG